LALADLDGDALAFGEFGKAGAAECGGVDEDVFAAVRGGDEAKPFGGVVPLYRALLFRAACHAEKGGIKGSLGLATDPSRFSIACRAVGKVTINGKLPDNEIVFGASANWLFKEIRVSRLWDAEKHVLVYLVWSTQALTPEGSPYNSISAVPVDPQQ